jgi:hypothetical protein
MLTSCSVPVKQRAQLWHRHAELIAPHAVDPQRGTFDEVGADVRAVDAEEARVYSGVQFDFWFRARRDSALVLDTELDQPSTALLHLPQFTRRSGCSVCRLQARLPPDRRRQSCLVGPGNSLRAGVVFTDVEGGSLSVLAMLGRGDQRHKSRGGFRGYLPLTVLVQESFDEADGEVGTFRWARRGGIDLPLSG